VTTSFHFCLVVMTVSVTLKPSASNVTSQRQLLKGNDDAAAIYRRLAHWYIPVISNHILSVLLVVVAGHSDNWSSSSQPDLALLLLSILIW